MSADDQDEGANDDDRQAGGLDRARAARELLPEVYAELRRLAARRMAGESADHTLGATALVHEAYVRLAGTGKGAWVDRGHFLAAAAEAMRRVLVDHARRKLADKRGGGWARVSLDGEGGPVELAAPDELLLLDETLSELAARDPLGGRLVELRYFAGLSVEEAGAAAGVSAATAYRHWAFARAWLHARIGAVKGSPGAGAGNTEVT